MQEVARASILTPSQLTANGRSVAVDLERIDEEDDLESLPVRALSVTNTPNNRASTNFASQFLPNRPDENPTLSTASPSQSSTQLAMATKANGGISRPDHLIQGSGAGGSGAAGSGAAGKARPHSTVIKSSAATLLSAGQGNSASAPNSDKGNNRFSVPPPARRSLSDRRGSNTSDSGAAGAGVGGAASVGQQGKKLFNKMASFFQR